MCNIMNFTRLSKIMDKKKISALLSVIFIFWGCATTKSKTINTLMGTSYDDAIVINSEDTQSGIDAEYSWLAENYPGYKFKAQSLQFKDGKLYDVITIITKEGEEKKIYFDISKFFGRW